MQATIAVYLPMVKQELAKRIQYTGDWQMETGKTEGYFPAASNTSSKKSKNKLTFPYKITV